MPKLSSCLLAVLVGLLAAACSPKVDPQAISAQIAATTAASVQQTLASLPTPTGRPTPVPATPAPVVTEPAFSGIWLNDAGDLLVINSRVIYLRYSENGTLYEHFAEVQVVDEARGEIDFFLHRIRVNGKFMGFDSPVNKAQYSLDQDALSFNVLVDPEDPSAGVRIAGQFTRGLVERFP
jgi:hypothetical protein